MEHLLNETYVYEQNVPWIEAVAKKYGKGLEYDDYFNIASIAFIIAVRLYQKRFGAFHAFAEIQIKCILESERKKNNRHKYLSAYSLDRCITADTTDHTMGETFFQSPDNVQEEVELKDFVEHIEDMHLRVIAGGILDDEETLKETQSGLDEENFQANEIEMLRNAWLLYSGEEQNWFTA